MDESFVQTVRLLLRAVPEVFSNDIFAMKGGTAINLFVRDMPRLSVDIDVAYVHWRTPEENALQADRKSTRLNSSHSDLSRMPSSA